jgi:hypothetical protein
LIILNKEQKNVKNPDIFTKLKWLKSNLVVSYEYNNENFVKESQRRSILDEATEPKMNIQNALNLYQKRNSIQENSKESAKASTRRGSNPPPKRDSTVTDLIKKMTKNYFKSDLFGHRCSYEFFEMVEYVTNIETEPIIIKKITFEGYCKSLIDYLMPDEDYYNTYDTIMSLRLFRMYIEAANKDIETGKCISDWEEDDWDGCQDQVEKRQNILIDMNITRLIAEIIAKENDQEIFEESINLAIGLTLGGNSKAQGEFYKNIIESKSMEILLKIKESMDVNFENIRECFEQRSEIITKGGEVEELDNYINSDKRIQDSLRCLQKIYRFLQLLCEGHNLIMQDFLRHQYKRTERLFSKNIDFVLYTSSQFGGFVKYLNPHITDLGNQILDFLVEVVQGPCRGNQKQLFDGKIVDYTKDLMLEFGTEKDYIIKGFDNDKKKELYSIIKKCIKLVLA